MVNNEAVAADSGSEAQTTTVLIADDHPLVLAGIRRTLEHSADIDVIGEASSAEQVLALIDRRRPQVVLLDLHMPGAVGSDLVQNIHRDWPEIKTVVLSATDDRRSIDSALSAGASAYIVKSVNPVDLASVIRQVAGGAIFHAQTAAPAVATSRPVSGPDLTDRELTILRAIASGATTSAISRELWVSEHTVKFHLTNIYRKVGVSNRAGAVRYAIENGLAE